MFCELPLIKSRDRNPAYMPSDIEWSLLADDVGDGVVLVSLLCGWRSVIQADAVPTGLLPCSSNDLRLFFKVSSNVLLFLLWQRPASSSNVLYVFFKSSSFVLAFL